jgi:hypothetical protein
MEEITKEWTADFLVLVEQTELFDPDLIKMSLENNMMDPATV